MYAFLLTVQTFLKTPCNSPAVQTCYCNIFSDNFAFVKHVCKNLFPVASLILRDQHNRRLCMGPGTRPEEKKTNLWNRSQTHRLFSNFNKRKKKCCDSQHVVDLFDIFYCGNTNTVYFDFWLCACALSTLTTIFCSSIRKARLILIIKNKGDQLT